jgi:hypothetical protein
MQGLNRISITMLLQSIGNMVGDYYECEFHLEFPSWQEGEKVATILPVPVFVPAGLAASLRLEEKYLVQGSFEITTFKNGEVWSQGLSITASACDPVHRFTSINKAFLFGKTLPLVKKDGTPSFEVIGIHGKKKSTLKMPVIVKEKIGINKNANGYYDYKDMYFNLTATVDSETGKGRGASLFPYLAGQAVCVEGSLDVYYYNGKTQISVFVGGANHHIEGVTISQEEKKNRPVEVKYINSPKTDEF